MTTTCTICGVEIQASTAAATGDVCVPCRRAQSPNSDAIASIRKKSHAAWTSYKPHQGTLVIAMFHPGFCADLTHWQIHLTIDGILNQQILWNNFDRPEQRKGFEVRSRNISPEGVDFVFKTVERLDIDSVKCLRDHATIDDAAMISLEIPRRQFSECLPLFAFEYYVKKGLISDAALPGLNTMRQTWDAIDSIAPYSLREHLQ
jgi:hypothetical protein